MLKLTDFEARRAEEKLAGGVSPRKTECYVSSPNGAAEKSPAIGGTPRFSAAPSGLILNHRLPVAYAPG